MKSEQGDKPNKNWNEALEAQWAYKHTNACRCECHCPNMKEKFECDFAHTTSCEHCENL